ncbi:PIR protein [Plasmodium vivax]|uniref:VIR protein n=1 Tax=Plasmodium vivax TaxID=5855 RepID=A0A565A4C6_PLAVI|nr:PIR protein [Plasmodium vivax]
MTCILKYLFFNDIVTYIDNTEDVEKDKPEASKYSFCNGFLTDSTFGSIANVVDICKQFVALYNKHSSLMRNMTGSPSYKRDCEYMNYWLNAKLNINNNNPIFVNKFYTKLRTLNDDFDKKGSLNGKIHDIDKNELEHLYLLYNLRQKYSKIYNWATLRRTENQHICKKSADDVFKDYMVAINDCSSSESIFCKLLCNLREEYNIVFDKYDGNNECKAQETKLQTYNELHPSANTPSIKMDSNTMSIPLLGPIIALVFILTSFYRFTAIGPWLRNKVRSIFSRDSNKNANRNELFLQNFDKQNINARPGVYNITYNSVRNN